MVSNTRNAAHLDTARRKVGWAWGKSPQPTCLSPPGPPMCKDLKARSWAQCGEGPSPGGKGVGRGPE